VHERSFTAGSGAPLRAARGRREGAAMSEAPFRPRTVRCPACGRDAVYAPTNPSRPFCSVRCRNSDLGAWASGAYGIEAAPRDDDEPKPDAIT
jgi:endogenous inhibitor of DNA gyrase (YacG/DUF329 family)